MFLPTQVAKGYATGAQHTGNQELLLPQEETLFLILSEQSALLTIQYHLLSDARLWPPRAFNLFTIPVNESK